MKKQFLTIAAAASFIAACSDVEFSAISESTSQKTGGSQEEQFTQGISKNDLDILFVVDNSTSMSEDQRKLGTRISSFLATLRDVNWQIGVTTTDTSPGKYGIKGDLLDIDRSGKKVLTAATPDYLNVFLNTVVRPESYQCDNSGSECPSGYEEPLKATILAMQKRATSNAGFFRDKADLAVIVLSDEDENSDGRNATQPETVVSTFRGIWGDTKQIYGYGMIVVPGDVSCIAQQGGDGKFGSVVNRFANLTGGITGSICSTDFGPTLSRVGERVRTLLNYVQLKNRPDPETLLVTFTPAHTTKTEIVDKRVYFEVAPPEGTKISVSYEPIGN